jgi:hypothetical protein
MDNECDTLPPPSMPTGRLTHEDLYVVFQDNFLAINKTLAESLVRLESQFAAAIIAQTELLERAMMLAFDRTAELHQKVPALETRLDKIEARLTLLEKAP